MLEGLLAGKVAVVTGAGSGVGRAATLLFAAQGARVMALDIHQPTLDETLDLAGQYADAVQGRMCDVSSPQDVEDSVQAAVAAFGGLDVIYNNAGIAVRTAGNVTGFLDATLEQFRKMADVNIGGVINGCQSAIRQFRKQAEAGRRGGAIVNNASLGGLIGYGSPVYGATKGAVVILTKSLALEMAGEGIRVNCTCPATMLTAFGVGRGGTYPDAVVEWANAAHPLGKATDPEDCANGALFLASRLSANITGHAMPIDGGLMAGVKI